jgi:hypothetical protein
VITMRWYSAAEMRRDEFLVDVSVAMKKSDRTGRRRQRQLFVAVGGVGPQGRWPPNHGVVIIGICGA